MERRVLLAIFLAFIVLYAWQALFVKPVPKPAARTTSTATSEPGAVPAPSPVTGLAPPVAATVPAAAPLSTATALVTAPADRDVRVETREVIAVFTNRGARLKSWRLKHFLDQG